MCIRIVALIGSMLAIAAYFAGLTMVWMANNRATEADMLAAFRLGVAVAAAQQHVTPP
jgi:hypothetical protein